MADLSNLANLAESHPEFVAHRLAAYQRDHRLNDEVLALLLSCTSDDLIQIRLCRLPRPDHFQEDVARIAEHTHCNGEALAQILSEAKI